MLTSQEHRVLLPVPRLRRAHLPPDRRPCRPAEGDTTARTAGGPHRADVRLGVLPGRDPDAARLWHPPYPRVIPANTENVRPVVTDMLRAGIDSFVYAGYAPGAVQVAARCRRPVSTKAAARAAGRARP
ncbi:hypothetical protein ACRAWF_03030 [Streptomyces sp. L7]